MKILFLAYRSFDFYKPIEEELIRQGHEVYTITDKILPFDFNIVSSSPIKRFVKRILRVFLLVEKRYWDKELKQDPKIDERYDQLLCYQGVSMSRVLLRRLQRHNPSIKTCVYIGDSSNYYNFYSRKALFDKIYTFDTKDADNIEGVEQLDPYWEENTNANQSIEYDLSAIGSDHDGRFEFTSKIYPQIKAAGLKTFIRVVSLKPKVDGLNKEKRSLILKEWEIRTGYPFVTKEAVPFDEFHRIIQASNCVLEIERENQAGITIRSLSAIARGKKVITTNYHLKDRPYYNPQQIQIIDRNNPVLDIDWIRQRVVFERPESIEKVRLDKWVKNLLIVD